MDVGRYNLKKDIGLRPLTILVTGANTEIEKWVIVNSRLVSLLGANVRTILYEMRYS